MTDDEVSGFLERIGVPGIVDAHVHFMPDPVQQAVWRWFDQLDPPWPVTYRMTAEERLNRLASVGVRHHTALAYAHRPGMLRFLNDHTLRMMSPETSVIPTFTVYPEPGVGAEVERCLDAGGRAVKVHLQVGAFDPTDRLLDPGWDRLEEAGTAIIIHAGAVADGTGNEQWCGPDPVRRLLERHPGLQLVVAHMGAPDFKAFLDLADQHPSLRFDTAMVFTDPPYLASFPEALLGRVADLGSRILFGSDFPTIPHAFAAQVAGLASLDFGEAWLRRVLWGNGVEVFGLDEAQ